MTDNQNPNIEQRYQALQAALQDALGNQYIQSLRVNYDDRIRNLENQIKVLNNDIKELETRISWMENHNEEPS